MKLKSFVLGALMLASASGAMAQEEGFGRTLLGPRDGHTPSWMMVVAPSVGYTEMASHDALITGIEIGAVRDRNFEIAGFFDIAGSNRRVDVLADANHFAESYDEKEKYGYGSITGGIMLRPIFFSDNPVHFSIPIKIGGGVVQYSNDCWSYDGDDCDRHWNNHGDNFSEYHREDLCGIFRFEPGFSLDMNLFSNIQFSACVSYRVLAGLDLDYKNKTNSWGETSLNSGSDLNQLTYSVSIRFGFFGN